VTLVAESPSRRLGLERLGATLPEKALPASSLVFARVDLDPGLGPALTIKSLADKFPKTSDKSVVDEMTRGIVSDLGLDPLDYDRDIKAWFGGRLGFAYWMRGATDRSGCGLVALASKDEAKASSALSKVRDTKADAAFGFAFHEGYAVTAACSDRREPERGRGGRRRGEVGSLATTRVLERDRLALGQLAVGYADLNRSRAPSRTTPRHRPDGGAGLSGGTESLAEGLKARSSSASSRSGLDVRYRMRGGAAPDQRRRVEGARRAARRHRPGRLGRSAWYRRRTRHGVLGGFGGLGGLDDVTGVDGVLTPGSRLGQPCDRARRPVPAARRRRQSSSRSARPREACFKLDEEHPAEIEMPRPPPFGPNDLLQLDEKAPRPRSKCVGPATPVDFSGGGGKGDLQVTITAAFSSFGDSPQARLAITAASGRTSRRSKRSSAARPPPSVRGHRRDHVTAKKDFAAGTGTLADGPRYQQALRSRRQQPVAFFLDVERLLPTLKLSDKERARLTPIKAVGGSFATTAPRWSA
jgi:hypothetical protein